MTLNVVPGTIYHMDNLDALRGMNSSIIDLIATDPPFNTGRNRESVGGKYVDQWRWEENVHRSWMDDIRDTNRPLVEVIEAAEHAHSENLGAFLCFLGVRLIEMKRVLKDTGSIYVHLDPTASHYVKGIMDAVFGARNFRNEIVWKRTSGRSDAKKFGAIHDTILYYSKGDSPTWNPIHLPHDPEYVKKFYRHDDGDGRGPWRSADLTAAGLRSGLSGASWRGVNPGKVGRHWGTPTGGGMYEYIIKNNIIPGWPDAYPTVPDRLDALDAAGLIYWPKKKGGVPCLKRYLASTKGNAACDVITDIIPVQTHATERTGYPDQKPVLLYERIIAASSNPGELVLDPFCGCGTTLVAAHNLDRQSIGIDRNDDAKAMILCNLANMKKAEVDDLRQKSQHTDPGWIDRILAKHEASFTNVPPERTDEDTEAIPGLPQVHRRKERALFSHAEMKDMLLDQWGPKGVLQCWGCEFSLPDTKRNRRYFDLDHINPKSGGGTNHLDNRAVLCGPCNGQKSDKLTLVALRIDVLGGRKQANAHPIDLKQTTTWARSQEIEALLAREREEKPLFTR